MSTLILDTSTELCFLALAEEGRPAAEAHFPHGNNLSKTLLPAIHSLAPDPSKLAAIALGVGPGSYTGTRLGAAVAKSLAFALGIPLKTFPSPLAFLPDQDGPFAFLLPARSGKTFLLKGEQSPSSLVYTFSQLVSPEEIPSLIANTSITLSAENLPPPNLGPLLKFLSATPATPPETAPLLYLQNSFVEKIPPHPLR